MAAGVREGADVLDIGCGFGGWAVLAHSMGARVTAVDPNPTFIARGQAACPSITWVEAPYAQGLVAPESQDLVLCIGSTHALGGLEAVLVEAAHVLRDRGAVLAGEGFWKQPPSESYLTCLGAEPDEMTTHAGNAERFSKEGWRVVYAATSSESEWDEYEGLYRSTMMQWVSENPTDPDTNTFRERSDQWFGAYLREGRATLGFGFYVASRT